MTQEHIGDNTTAIDSLNTIADDKAVYYDLQGTGIQNIASATDAAVIKTAIYAADGTQLSNPQPGKQHYNR